MLELDMLSSSSNSASSPEKREGGGTVPAALKSDLERCCLFRFVRKLQRAGGFDEQPR
jgi:hypothetical protein